MTLSEAPPVLLRHNEAPLSTNQDFLCMFDNGDAEGVFGPRHLVVFGWRLTGQVDLAVLRAALDDVAARHEVLRSLIVRGEPSGRRQVMHPPGSPELLVHDFDPADSRSRDLRIEEFLNDIESGTFDVGRLPHLRAVLGRFDERDSILILITHHTASDGWSMQVLIRDIAVCYGLRKGYALELPEFRQYREYADWQQQNPSTDAARDYWRDKLSGGRLEAINKDRIAPAGDTAVYS